MTRGPLAARAVLALLGLALVAGAPTGLDRPFPALAGEPPTPIRVELGRLLFFDPVLSGDGARACADCHRPMRAFTDGLPRARGRDGRALARNTPTLYNVGYKRRWMWDRRASSLEDQALLPLLSPRELGAEPRVLLARLQASADYRARFAAAFPDDAPPIRLRHVARALAAFERTLVSRNSRYDRYARGDRAALAPAERRGLALFRSLNTRCFECHRPPTFDAPLSLAIGVPSDDPGVGAVSGVAAQRGQFGVPTLRNVARTAPYMHDGSLATLRDVVDFYRRGGGRAHGAAPRALSGHIRAFDISDGEADDLVAFLHALTDESGRPATPAAVPSGLPLPRTAASERVAHP